MHGTLVCLYVCIYIYKWMKNSHIFTVKLVLGATNRIINSPHFVVQYGKKFPIQKDSNIFRHFLSDRRSNKCRFHCINIICVQRVTKNI